MAAFSIVTLVEAKNFVGEVNSTNDVDIQRMIDGLSALFEGYTHRKIVQQTLTDYRIDGNGCRSVLLPFSPVQSVTAVKIRYSSDDTTYKNVTDTTKFVVKDKNLGLLQMFEDTLICGKRNVLVTMSVGYLAADGELLSIKDIFLRQFQFDYIRWQNREVGVNSKTFADGSLGFVPSGGLLKETKERLDQFVDLRFV